MSGKTRAAPGPAIPDTSPRVVLDHALCASAAAAREAAAALVDAGARDDDHPASTAAARFEALYRASLRGCPATGRASSVVEAVESMRASAVASAASLDLGDRRAGFDHTVARLAASLALAAEVATHVDDPHREAGAMS